MILAARAKILIFWIARSVGLFLACRLLTHNRIRILCYHGGCLGDERNYNPKLFMTFERFEARMRWLVEKRFAIIPLDKAVDLLSNSDRRTKLPTIITFDDGWHSTGSELIPVLARLGLPSTLYLCTQHFEEGWPVVAVAVRYVIWRIGTKEVCITRFGTDLDGKYRLGDASVREELCEKAERWIAQHAHGREQVCAALERLAASGGIPAAELSLDSQRFDFMSRDELRAAASMGCSVELHGHVHRYPAGDPAELSRDLRQCADIIVDAGLPAPRHYCYPSGEFDDGAFAALEALGVKSATTCLPGLVGKVSGERRYLLPRFLDGESVSDLEFEAEMSGFAEFMRRLVGRQ